MSFKECCKNCKHCVAPQVNTSGWCLLRKIQVHPEMAQFAFCHHWSSREPTLPTVGEKYLNHETQLDFGKTFAALDH